MTTSSLSENIIVMEITQLEHSRKEFAKVAKVMYQNYCKPGVRTYLSCGVESASLLAKCHV